MLLSSGFMLLQTKPSLGEVYFQDKEASLNHLKTHLNSLELYHFFVNEEAAYFRT